MEEIRAELRGTTGGKHHHIIDDEEEEEEGDEDVHMYPCDAPDPTPDVGVERGCHAS